MIRKALYRVKSVAIAVIASVFSMIVYKITTFQDHMNGPKYVWVFEDFDNWLKWEGKANNTLQPFQVRHKLAELMYERGIYKE